MSTRSKLDDETRRMIYRAWTRGLSPLTLAETYGFTSAEVEAVVGTELDQLPALGAKTPERIALEYEVRIRAYIDEAAAVAPKGNPRDRVAAVRVRFEAERHLLELQQAIGLLPRDLGRMGVEIDFRKAGEAILGWLDEHGTEPEEIRELADVIDRAMRGDGDNQQIGDLG
jgi:hypothetical protein